MERKYYPSFAELIDRLTIVSQKELYATTDEMRNSFVEERKLIIHDINVFLNGGYRINGEELFASLVLQLVNSHIWENESGGRGDESGKKDYELTHALNADRANVKKYIQNQVGGRVDHKLNYINGKWNFKF